MKIIQGCKRFTEITGPVGSECQCAFHNRISEMVSEVGHSVLWGQDHRFWCSFSKGVQVQEEAWAPVTVVWAHHLSTSCSPSNLLSDCSWKNNVLCPPWTFSPVLLNSDIETKQVKGLRSYLTKISRGGLESWCAVSSSNDALGVSTGSAS